MKLDDYLKLTRIKLLDAASQLEITRYHLWCIRKGKAHASKKLQARIVEWSHGVVTFEHLNGQ